MLAAVGFGIDICHAQGSDRDVTQPTDAERARYAEAVAYCRGDAPRPMTLSADKTILCLDGATSVEQDISLAKDLEQNGLFVVRSWGGDFANTIALAELLGDKHATVVIYDHCLSACASFLLFASERTLVLKDSLVGWSYPGDWPWCPTLVPTEDKGPNRVEVAPCSDAPAGYQYSKAAFWELSRKFYERRAVGSPKELPPQSFFIRRRLKSMLEGTGRFPNVYWTWNPRYYSNAMKTRVVYEAYPQSQDEIDVLAARLGIRALYDP